MTAVCPGPVRTEFFDIAQTTGTMPLYKLLAMADPKRVVKKAIRDSVMGKRVSVYGPLMKLFFAAAKILPHSLLLAALSALSPQKVTAPETAEETNQKGRVRIQKQYEAGASV